MKQKSAVSIFWFRRDLRLEDNTALVEALNSPYPVLPVFIFDPDILNALESNEDARVQFILEEVRKIKNALESYESTLLVFHDKPENAFVELQKKYNVRAVFANRDYEPKTIARDSLISNLLSKIDVKLHLFKDQIIFEGKELLKQDGTPYKVFTPFKKLWLDKYAQGQIDISHQTLFEKFYKMKPAAIPDLDSLGFKKSDISVPKKEVNLEIIKKYNQNRDFPAIEGTSRLGMHLRFGTLSIRKLTQIAHRHNETWLNELIWREFYSSILQHFPKVTTEAFNKKYNFIPWRNDENEFARWCKGQTGYPLVDAGMRELNQTGYMHNRVRMVVASFLTKHLLIDWRWGEAYFAHKLLDFELASNNGGWQWAAGTGTDAQPYFRVFNPQSQAEKFDPNLKYIKRWVPEIESLSYPEPIVDHKQARLRAIETYKAAIS
jgi:deoxyribodipyrimidine photo-lyase